MSKYIVIILIYIHSILHLLGFSKGYKLFEINKLSREINKTEAWCWLIVAVLFMFTALLYSVKKKLWWMTAFIAVIFSQTLIILNWEDAKYGSIINIFILIIAILAYTHWSFYSSFNDEVKSNISQKTFKPEEILSESDISHLPELIKKYIHYTGVIGKPKVNNFKIEFSGNIRKNNESNWMPFTSIQYNFLETTTRLFFMKAKMKHLPVTGFHCFRNGKASMDIRLFSLFTVQYQSGKEMEISETVTFFNDMCCMAPASLIDKRIKWLETNGNKIKASFTNNDITITSWLYFNDAGELIDFISNDRYAVTEEIILRKNPWSTPLKNYKLINERKLPTSAQTIYKYENEDFCYGNFNLLTAEYNCKYS